MQICKELEGGECKAKVLLDKLCRNNTVVRTMVTSDYKTNIPLKDRCGVHCTVVHCTVLYCADAGCTTWRWPPTPAPPLR